MSGALPQRVSLEVVPLPNVVEALAVGGGIGVGGLACIQYRETSGSSRGISPELAIARCKPKLRSDKPPPQILVGWKVALAAYSTSVLFLRAA